MTQKHILQLFPMYHQAGEEMLNAHARVTKFNQFEKPAIIEFLNHHQVDGIILRAPAKITPDILDACHQVRAISGAGVGLDNIDVNYATRKEIAVLHAPKINARATAEHAICLILASMKDLVRFNRETKKGNFDYRNGRYTRELYQKNLGLIGFGSIAQRVAKIMSFGFEMNVTAYVRNINREKREIARSLGVTLTTSLEDVFTEKDVISVHIPLTDDTNQLINEFYLNLMKKGAVLINTARGEVIHEQDLVKAVESGKLSRAGIDVFANEPPEKHHPFYPLDNITVTPHIGGISVEAARETSIVIAENLLKAIDGESVPTIANQEVLQMVERKR
ncbi:D-3-phosphoglycerate dehydrogenase [Salinibacillus kushneri]|uniref:D-3-phosphoglycerate dehydrogenase n=1 Tax=Salinibacillus kushneri TaxID=237682 RepID=A0A1H9Z8G1_9BACI|nr:NAD(P)-dependent oxidoreductase [Salinibacillus kushneri]SES77763.1 D-3-phosphoglycerate dehydrogenase [Salinibacillus kushneri]